LREEVPVLPDDDEVRLHQRIKSIEHRLLPRAVEMALATVSALSTER
jgi:folate-dependent phosphoribosylglycinamide formyltransferase PurN